MNFLLSSFFTVLVSRTLGFLSLPLLWVSFALCFYHGSSVGLLLRLASSLCGLHRDCFSQVKPKSQQLRCQGSVVSSVLSRHNKKFKRRTLKPSARHSSWTVLQPRVTALFYSEDKGNISSRASNQKDAKTRER